jgi:hypothetical protein
VNQPFVPRMWASAKINALLEQIALYGERQELVDGVKALGLKYAIVTPYTSLVTIPNTAVKPGQVAEDKTLHAPLSMKLMQNVPNPIRSITQLRYSIPLGATPRQVSINIYDVKGRLVRKLVRDLTMGGNFFVQWDARDQAGKRVAAGFYFAVLESQAVRSMIQMRVL